MVTKSTIFHVCNHIEGLLFIVTYLHVFWLDLGLDPSGYKHAVHYDEEEEALMNGTEISDEEKYRDCERFKFVCPGATCSREIIVDAVFMGAVSTIRLGNLRIFTWKCCHVKRELLNRSVQCYMMKSLSFGDLHVNPQDFLLKIIDEFSGLNCRRSLPSVPSVYVPTRNVELT